MVIIQGSPRKNGSTRFLSSVMAQSAQGAKAQVSEIDGTKLSFKIPGCIGCGSCHESEQYSCVVDDELAKTTAGLVNYDVLAFATPTYWMSYPAQLKMMVDRMGSLVKFDQSGSVQTPLSGKVLAVMATGNDGMEDNMALLEGQVKSLAHMLSCQFHSCMFPNIPRDLSTLREDSRLIEKAGEFGRLLSTAKEHHL